LKTGYKIWISTVVLLVVLNVALIATIWLKPGFYGPPPLGKDKKGIANTLELTEEQKETFQKASELNHQTIDSFKRVVKNVREQYFSALATDNPTPNDSLAKLLANYHELIEQQTFRHFAAVRSTLNEKQKKIFDAAISDIIKGTQEQPHFRGDGSGPPGPPPGDGPRRPGMPPCEGCPPPPDDGPPPRP
jgi:CRISPR/Cas system-associated endonuclease/helicase Cas3